MCGQPTAYNAYATLPYTNPLFMGFSRSQNVNKEIISRTLKTLVNTGLQGFFDTSENMTENLRKELLKSLEDSKSVNNIQALADDILSITNQTNLLALNASIGQ